MASVLLAKYNIISHSVTLFIDNTLLTAYELLLKLVVTDNNNWLSVSVIVNVHMLCGDTQLLNQNYLIVMVTFQPPLLMGP